MTKQDAEQSTPTPPAAQQERVSEERLRELIDTFATSRPVVTVEVVDGEVHDVADCLRELQALRERLPGGLATWKELYEEQRPMLGEMTDRAIRAERELQQLRDAATASESRIRELERQADAPCSCGVCSVCSTRNWTFPPPAQPTWDNDHD